MAKRKLQIKQAEVVHRFAVRLRELRVSRGMTQAELAGRAHVTVSYFWRLESGAVAPGIDLVQRLADGLGVPLSELLPTTEPPDTDATLRDQARKLSEKLIESASREDLLMICPLLARLAEPPIRRR